MHVRDILDMTEDELWDLDDPTQKYGSSMEITFDDGHRADLPIRETILSSYCWWPQAEWGGYIDINCHLNDRQLTTSVLTELMEYNCWDTRDRYVDGGGVIDNDYLYLRIKQELNHITNIFNSNLGGFITSISRLDFYELTSYPPIKALNDELKSSNLDDPDVLSTIGSKIDSTHNKIEHILRTDPKLRNNRIVQAILTEAVKMNQVLQCISARGFVTDLDSRLLPYPILNSYCDGMTSVYYLTADSRTSSMALALQKDTLADSEYFNRQMQLLCAIVREVDVDYDCQSTEYIPWQIEETELPALHDLYYKEIESDELKIIDRANKELVGKTVMLRTALTCQHHDSHKVCGVCYGEARLNVPELTNIGHLAASELCGDGSQLSLSHKHYSHSAAMDKLNYSNLEAQYLSVSDNQYQIGLKQIRGKVSLTFQKTSMENINDIFIPGINISDLIISKISTIERFILNIDDDGITSKIPLILTSSSRPASLTTDVLKYIHANGIQYNHDNTITIDMTGYDFKVPIWELPIRQSSMMDYLNSIQQYIKSTGSNSNKVKMDINDSAALGEALLGLHQLVNTKINGFPIFMLAVILKATMCRSVKEKDYRLPAKGTSRCFANFATLMKYRSLGATLPFEAQLLSIKNVDAFLVKNRPPHQMDSFIIKG